jgi:hypothetical protein
MMDPAGLEIRGWIRTNEPPDGLHRRIVYNDYLMQAQSASSHSIFLQLSCSDITIRLVVGYSLRVALASRLHWPEWIPVNTELVHPEYISFISSARQTLRELGNVSQSLTASMRLRDTHPFRADTIIVTQGHILPSPVTLADIGDSPPRNRQDKVTANMNRHIHSRGMRKCVKEQ